MPSQEDMFEVGFIGTDDRWLQLWDASSELLNP